MCQNVTSVRVTFTLPRLFTRLELKIMKVAKILLAVCVLVVAAQSLRAIEVQIRESGSAMLKCQKTAVADWYVSNLNGSVYVTLTPGNPDNYALAGVILWYFNIWSYTGRTVAGDADVSVGLNWGESGPHPFGLYEPSNAWDESVVTWQNYLGHSTTSGPPAANKSWTNYFGPMLDRTDVSSAGVLYHWTVPSNVVQRWLDDPASCKGLAIIPDNWGNNMFWTRLGTWQPTRIPCLTINFASNNKKPTTPTNQTPANAAIGVPLNNVVLSASAFNDPNGDAFSNSHWQVSTDKNFVNSSWDSGTVGPVTNITVATALQHSTRYYWRVRYRDGNTAEGQEWSEWSAPTQFDTALSLIDPVSKIDRMSAMIKPGGDFSNSNITGRTVGTFLLVNPLTNVAPSGFLMYWFDLSVYSMYTGMVVAGTPKLQVSTAWADVTWPATFDLRVLQAPWAESNVTWNNYIGPNWGLWTNKVGDVLNSVLVNEGYTTYEWAVPVNIVQQWIDNPNQNFGLALVPQGTGNAYMRTRQSTPPPRLIFDLNYSGAPAPATPTNVAPVNGAADQSLTPTLTSSPYSGAAPHAATQWQLSESSSMSPLKWDTGSRTTDLLSVSVPASVSLTNNTRYYWRLRHISTEGGKSAWSDVTYFDTPIEQGTFTKVATRMAMINYRAQDSNVNGNVSTLFFPNSGASNGIFGNVIMCRFNLDVFGGKNAEAGGDGLFNVRWQFVDENFGAINFSAFPLLAPWDENTVTWGTYVGAGPDLTNVFGETFGSQQVIAPGSPGGENGTTWTVPQAVIQTWLDSAAANFGVALYPDQGNANAILHGKLAPGTAPKLTAEIIPEPAAVLLLGLAGLLGLRRPRR